MVDRSVSAAPLGVGNRPTPSKVPEQEITRPTPTLDSVRVVAELRAKLRTGGPTSEVAQRIVEAAQMVTRADGAAIAMRRNHSFLCVARAGNMAPDLGSELDVDSGISGECLRTGAALRCDDTTRDARVDGEACRRLGLRSLAVAAVGKKPAVKGILEVFSAESYAFNEADMRLLADLAELVMTAQSSTTKSTVARRRHRRAAAPPKWYRRKFIIPLAAAAALGFLGWLAFREKPILSEPSEAYPISASAQAPAVLAQKPSAIPAEAVRSPAVPARNISFARGVVMVRATEKTRATAASGAENPQPQPSTLSTAGTSVPNVSLPSPESQSAADTAVTPPPVTVASGGTETVLAGVLAPPNTLPVEPAMRISEGISGGSLERHVDPIYPAEARRLNIEGRVILQALVTEEGAVEDLKVIAGDQLLARAAMNAVTQWRYRPYRLNGQPIRMKTQITLLFKLR